MEEAQEIAYSGLCNGIDEAVLDRISRSNNDPDWMRDIRKQAFGLFQETPLPAWGPDLSGLDLDSIRYFAIPEESVKNMDDWENVPERIRRTFDRLGIPEAEKKMLAGVGAQFDSEVVYHSMKEEYRMQGIIFEDMSIACRDHSELLRRYFMKAVPVMDHKFSMLHAAVWSSGTFLFIPKGVKVSDPLQAYFRMNVRSGGQFEHTIIVLEDGAEAHYIEGCSAPKYGSPSLHAGCVEIYVGKGAKLRYSSVENWSEDTYNLNTKRALVQEDGAIEWVGGNLGAGVTMLYPCSVLIGDRSSSSHTSVAFANSRQTIDAGAKVVHIGKHTASKIVSKSLSKSGGISVYRGLVDIKPGAVGSIASIRCDGLLLDGGSVSTALPTMRISDGSATVAHEATAGRLNEEHLFYLTSRGIGRKDAESMLVRGFLDPVMKELPLEYASEMNVIIAMEMEENA